MCEIAIARKHKGLKAVELFCLLNCGAYHQNPEIEEKINRIYKICSNTVMNVDDATKDQIHNSLLKKKRVGIRLYWLQILMSLGNNGELLWDVKDSIDPEFAEIDCRSVF